MVPPVAVVFLCKSVPGTGLELPKLRKPPKKKGFTYIVARILSALSRQFWAVVFLPKYPLCMEILGKTRFGLILPARFVSTLFYLSKFSKNGGEKAGAPFGNMYVLQFTRWTQNKC